MSFPTDAEIVSAAAVLRAGGLVGFPTETVYGLGANALDPIAVERIYEAKGRPRHSPLIVHVNSLEMARELASEWPQAAETLALAFWPGPLTLVLPKRGRVPDVVTAGLRTVGLRMPAHPVALALIRAAGLPLAAPSANRFMRLSPTTAEHVRLADVAELVLDGGPSSVGIESTVLSLAGEAPVLLRPGAISQHQIEALIGPVTSCADGESGVHLSPGQHLRHYQPVTPLFLETVPRGGRGAYLWWSKPADAGKQIAMPNEPKAYAALLYSKLHELDAEKLDWIAVEMPPDSREWAGVRDRLKRAAAQ